MQIQAPIARAGRQSAIIALLAVLCAGLWTVPGAVLCVAPDGSIAIEVAGVGGACLNRSPQPTRDAPQFAENRPRGAAECAGCTDLPLNRLPASVRDLTGARRLLAPHAPLLADAIDLTPERAIAPPGYSFRRARLPSSETPLHLASTVLLR